MYLSFVLTLSIAEIVSEIRSMRAELLSSQNHHLESLISIAGNSEKKLQALAENYDEKDLGVGTKQFKVKYLEKKNDYVKVQVEYSVDHQDRLVELFRELSVAGFITSKIDYKKGESANLIIVFESRHYSSE